MPINKNYKYFFSTARIFLGLYFMILFAGQWLDREALFIRFFKTSEFEINFLFFILFFMSIFFTLGIFRKISSIFILLFLIRILQINFFLNEIHFGYITWMLLFFALTPNSEPLSIFPRSNPNWKIPSIFFHSCLFCLGASYTASGLAKHSFPGWNSGEAIKFFFHAGVCRPYICKIAESFSQVHFIFMAYFVGLFELIALPAILFKKTRPYIWIILTAGQIQMLFTFSIFNISIALIIFHILCFNPSWIYQLTNDFKFVLHKLKKSQKSSN